MFYGKKKIGVNYVYYTYCSLEYIVHIIMLKMLRIETVNKAFKL